MVEKSFPNLRSGESLSADVARKSVMSVWIAGIREKSNLGIFLTANRSYKGC